MCVYNNIITEVASDVSFAIFAAHSGLKPSPTVIVAHPDFRMIVLANRPGFPFLGNDFFGAMGKCSMLTLSCPVSWRTSHLPAPCLLAKHYTATPCPWFLHEPYPRYRCEPFLLFSPCINHNIPIPPVDSPLLSCPTEHDDCPVLQLHTNSCLLRRH